MFPIDPLANGAPSRRDRSGVSPAGESGSSQRLQRKLVAFATAGTLAAFVAGFQALPAEAQVTAPIAVTAAVQATCLISATPVAFGTYVNTLASNATGGVSVTCTNTTPYTIGLNAGTFVGATTLTRAMIGPDAGGLKYQLTSDAALAVNWGIVVGTDTVAGVGTGIAIPAVIYGHVASGQLITPGAYNDTITATVAF